MPSINIKELDNTLGGGSANSTDIVYVPGFMSTNEKAWPNGTKSTAFAREPILCRTIAEFEMYFGSEPAKFERDVTYAELNSIFVPTGPMTIENGVFVSQDSYDKSYLYAKELLNLGIPVLYESINTYNPEDINNVKAANVLDMYNAFTGDSTTGVESIFKVINEKSEYEIKYITSGGYPTFEAGVTEKEISNKITYTKTSDTTLDSNKDYYTKQGNSYVKVDTASLEDESVQYAQVEIAEGDEPQDGVTYYTLVEGEYMPQEDLESFELDTTYYVAIAEEIDLYEQTITQEIVGGVASNAIAAQMLATASERGDCIALLDHTDNPNRALTGNDSVHKAFKDFAQTNDNSSFGAAFTPWVNVNCITLNSKDKVNSMPPSFAYLAALAKSIKTNANWIAVAGATRGQIPNLSSAKPLNINARLTNAIAEETYQNRDSVSINAITNIKPFGYRIWGNRTLKNNSIEQNLTATSFLNVRNLVSDVKKITYQACKKFTFEQNDDVLWANFTSYIEPTLIKMQTGSGLSGYKIVKGTTSEKAKLVATIKLYPIYAVEDFDITVIMEDDEIKVS